MTLRQELESKAINHFREEHNLGKEAICGCDISLGRDFSLSLRTICPSL